MAKRSVDESLKLLEHLHSNEPLASVYLLYGEDNYLIERAISAIAKKRFKSEAIDPLSWEQYFADDKSLDIRSVLDSLRTVTMFGGAKVAILKAAQNLKEEDLKLLLDYVQKPNPRSHLVVVASKIDGRKSSWATLKAKGFSVQCTSLSEYEVSAWISAEARSRGLKLSQEAVDFMSLLIGNNRSIIDQSLEKIEILFGKAKPLGRQDIEDSIVDTRERSVFELTKALSQRKIDAAFNALAALIEQGQEPIAINAMLARQARMSLQVKLAQNLRMSDQEIIEQCKIAPFALAEYKNASRLYSLDELYRFHALVFEADRTMKSMPVPKDLVLGQILLSFLGKRR